jgi:hypothetical protein
MNMADSLKVAISWNERLTRTLKTIDRDSRPSIIERLLPGSEHAAKAAERRRRRLDDSKKELATLEADAGLNDAATIEKALADQTAEWDPELLDAVTKRESDSWPAIHMRERLKASLHRLDTLSSLTRKSAIGRPPGYLEASVQREIDTAVGLLAKLRDLGALRKGSR